MVFHIVLFRPKPDISDSDRRALLDALADAAKNIAVVRRFYVGRRVTHGRGYEQMVTQDFPYAAVIEFDDIEGLRAYLRHPAHEQLGAKFSEFLDVGLVYDFEMVNASGMEAFFQSS